MLSAIVAIADELPSSGELHKAPAGPDFLLFIAITFHVIYSKRYGTARLLATVLFAERYTRRGFFCLSLVYCSSFCVLSGSLFRDFDKRDPVKHISSTILTARDTNSTYYQSFSKLYLMAVK